MCKYLIEYELDEDGEEVPVLDEDGNYVLVLDEEGNPIIDPDGDYFVIYDEELEDNLAYLFEKYAYRNLPQEKLQLLNNKWEEIKVDSESFGGAIYIICGAILLLIVVFAVYSYIVKCKRRRLYWNRDLQKS